MAKLKIGDVIYVERDCGIFGYKHFGVYSGSGKVIHYVKGDGAPLDGVIRETSFEEFAGNDACCRLNPDDNSLSERNSIFGSLIQLGEILFGEQKNIYSPEETVARARSCIGQRGYDLFVHNCEHFAVWCKTGIEKSEQVDKFIDVVFKIAEEAFVKSKFR